MKPEIKAKWVSALRSGEYKQGECALRKADRFCCLGVLCDIHAKETGNEWKSQAYLGDVGLLPRQVQLWAALARSPMVGDDTLTELNDCGVDFAKIANLIEKHL